MAEGSCSGESPPRKLRRNSEAAEGSGRAEVHGINIDCLPEEVMINIFSSLSFNDLVDKVQSVCTRWKRLAHDPMLWLDKEYIIRGRNSAMKGRSCCGVVWSKCIHCRYEGTDEQILRTAGVTPQLRKLTLMRNVKVDVLKKIVTNWPNLTTLKIDGRQKSDDPELLKHIFEKCPKIQKLTLEAGLLVGQKRCQVLSALEDLRSLEVFVGRHYTSSLNMRELAAACPRLEEINLKWDGHDVDGVADFLKAKQDSITSATLLPVLGNMETDRCVVPMLKQCHRLRKLELDYDYAADCTASETFEALGELHGLEELSIKRGSPQPPEAMSLAFRPGCLTQLRRLLLRCIEELQDETLVAISRGCPNLRELRLYGAYSITDEGLSEIHCLKHLKILVISECTGLCRAMAYIAQLPALQTLVLELFEDLLDLEPSLREILDMKELRRLDILGCGNFYAVPYSEFPGRLVKLRELRVTYEEEYEFFYENTLANLQRRMPHLRVFNTYWLEDGDDPRDVGCIGSSYGSYDSDGSYNSADTEYSEEGGYVCGYSYAGYGGIWF